MRMLAGMEREHPRAQKVRGLYSSGPYLSHWACHVIPLVGRVYSAGGDHTGLTPAASSVLAAKLAAVPPRGELCWISPESPVPEGVPGVLPHRWHRSRRRGFPVRV